mgnify:CR=1 FL=1
MPSLLMPTMRRRGAWPCALFSMPVLLHVLNRGGRGVDSPADRLGFGPESHLGTPE